MLVRDGRRDGGIDAVDTASGYDMSEWIVAWSIYVSRNLSACGADSSILTFTIGTDSDEALARQLEAR